MYAELIYVDESMKMSKVPLQTVGCDTSSPYKNSSRFSSLCLSSSFPGIFYVCHFYFHRSPHLGKCCLRLLGVENRGGCSWEEVTSMGWHHRLNKTKLHMLNIFRAALCSDQ